MIAPLLDRISLLILCCVLSGCAMTLERVEIVLDHDCAGRERTVRIEYWRSPAPTLACIETTARVYPAAAALAVLQVPLACAVWMDRTTNLATRREATIILPSWLDWEWIEAHEREHVLGRMTHPPFLPMLELPIVGCD